MTYRKVIEACVKSYKAHKVESLKKALTKASQAYEKANQAYLEARHSYHQDYRHYWNIYNLTAKLT